MSKEEIEEFAKRVLLDLGLTDWQMEWDKCSGGICIKDVKRFTIPERMIGRGFEAKEYVLHEIAHIFTDDNYHGKDYYREYIKLLSRFLVASID